MPQLANITAIRWDGYSIFNGITFRVEQRLSRGLGFTAFYTLSHAIDDASDPGGTAFEANLPQDVRNMAAERADASFDHRHRFVGNVMGRAGQMSGWVYESGDMDTPSIYKLGWDGQPPYPTDAKVTSTAVRHRNFDYVTNSVKWDPSIQTRTLPNSLYLSGRPAFFDAGRGYTWPWVDPTGTTKLYTLPAQARFEAGTPFVQP